MDTLIIESLEVQARVGVTAAERQVGQWLAISIEASYDARPAGKSDDLGDTVSYAALAQIAYQVATDGQFRLLEALAERIAERLLAELAIRQIRLRLLKRPPPLPMKIAAAGIEIVRTRGP